MMDLQILGNPLYDWLTALGIALAINLAVAAVVWFVRNRLQAIVGKTESALDDSLVRVAGATRQWLVFAITLFIGTHYLTLVPRVETVLKIVATAAAFLQAGLWAGALVDFWLTRYRARTDSAAAATSLGALGFVAKLILWSLVGLLLLDNLGVDVTALVAGLGVGGIAVALAVQNVLSDLFASLSIVIDKPFVIGDFIVVDDLMGTVEHVGLKTTRVRSLGGEQLIFSNSDLLGSRVRNYKRMRERRAVLVFGVLYQTPVDQVEAIPGMVKKIIDDQENARFDRAHFVKFGDSSLDFEVVYWIGSPEYQVFADIQQAVNIALMRKFEQEKIGFAYPTRSLFVEAPVKVELARGS